MFIVQPWDKLSPGVLEEKKKSPNIYVHTVAKCCVKIDTMGVTSILFLLFFLQHRLLK